MKKNTFILRASGSQFTCAPHSIEFLIIEQAKRFDQNQIVVEARKVDPGQPLSPWRSMKLNDFDLGLDFDYVCYASLEPSISNRLAVKVFLLGSSRFLILNLATREIICHIYADFRVDLRPVSWWAGNILFVRRLSKESEIQVLVFDPSGSKVPQDVKQLEQEATYLLPGPTVKRSGAAEFPFIDMIQIDWFGVVMAKPSTLFIASVD
jgi:hypothetical protein